MDYAYDLEITDRDGNKIAARYDPNYRRKCEVCGSKPCVRIRTKGERVFYDGTMCGSCTWGEADCVDPDNW